MDFVKPCNDPLSVTDPCKHPLDQLQPDEILKAVEIVRREKILPNKRHRFSAIDLSEPSKEFILSFRNGQKFERKADLSVFIDDDNQLFDAVVSLTDNMVISWKEVSEGQPSILGNEFFEVEEAVKKSEVFKQALLSRGIMNSDLVWVDPWSVGNYGLAYESTGRRLAMGICFLQKHPGENAYVHPIDGLIPIVDINELKIIHMDNFHPTIPIPQKCFHYDYETKQIAQSFRSDLKPLIISQPSGPSFTVNANEVQWQRWSFRVGFTAREGLVLHNIAYEDRGQRRSILYRASLSEMVVPYGDPRPQHFRKNAFDVGEYGVGRMANSLKKGCQCFGDVHYFDGYVHDTKGNVICIENAICMHEEDNGILWKHSNWRTGEGKTRRSRRLVLSFFATLANYEYGFYWYFYLDGSIEFEVKLTGANSAGAAFDNEVLKHGVIISPNLYAPVHQHFFCFRLDFALDGNENSVYEVNFMQNEDISDNPQNNAYYPEYRLLETDTKSVGQIDSRKHRFWKIVNPNVKNIVSQPVAYRLEPLGNSFPFTGSKASVAKRAGFIKNHVWITQFDPSQIYAAGKYPNQHPGGDGLDSWISQNKPIVNKDIVLWYTLGLTHLPRSEDFPVMPATSGGFMLKPDGFFSCNPAIDLPPSCKSGKEV